jgi:tetratricopeptide (TPR) repeat protein
MAVWRKFPVLGTGLGTHAYVFPAYDRTGAPQLAQYAENDYVQALEETGAAGLVLVVAFVAIVWALVFRATRAQRPRVCAAAIGLGYGLAAVMVQSLSDFGQHVPAVAALSAVTCGLVVVLARLARQAKAAEAVAEVRGPDAAALASGNTREASRAPDAAAPETLAKIRPSRMRLAVPVVATALLAWAGLGAYAAYSASADNADASRIAATLGHNGWASGSDEDFTRLLEHAGAAADARPDDVEARYWLNVYRWRALARERDPSTGELLLTQEALDHTGRIVDELHAARPLCPTYGPLVSLAGQLELFILDRPQGLEHIRAAYALAPNHPDVVFTAAMADATRGDWDGSVAKFIHCVELAPQMVGEVIDAYDGQFDRPDLAVKVAEKVNDPTPLMQISNRLKKKGTHPDVAAAAWRGAVAILERWCERPDAVPWALASLAGIYRNDGKTDAAVALYRRALTLDYSEVDWRLELARTLAAMGKPVEALREAQICIRLRPNMEAAKDLVATLSVESPATQPAVHRSKSEDRRATGNQAEAGGGTGRIASE